jgi:hypothetical protein
MLIPNILAMESETKIVSERLVSVWNEIISLSGLIMGSSLQRCASGMGAQSLDESVTFSM